MNTQVQAIVQAEISRWEQHRADLARQYELLLKDADNRLAALRVASESISAPLTTFDLSLVTSPLPELPIAAPAPAPEPATTPVVAATPAPVPAPAPVAETAVEAAETAEDDTNSVELGRGGKPKLTEGMRYVLEKYGPLHPTDIAKKIEENGLSPNSKNLVDYIRYTLSKNKALFSKVPGQRGMWQANGVSSPVAAPGDEEEEDLVDDGSPLGGQTPEMAEVEAFREKMKTGTVKLTAEQARSIVDEMSDPRKRMALSEDSVSASTSSPT